MKKYIELRVAVIVLSNIEIENLPENVKHPEALPEKEIERIEKELSDAVLFYWINSKLNLFLKLDYYVVDEKIRRNDFFENNIPKHGEILKVIKNAGEKVPNYVGVFVLSAKRRWNEQKKIFEFTGVGGGLTYGADLRGYGFSWFDITPENFPFDNTWVFVHEFHHQLDFLMSLSNHPEYWSNHPSPKTKNTASFGEHYDCNAYILRNWDVRKWFDLTYGIVREALDEDNDGIPDENSELPIDEKKFTSRTDSIDSDGDGLSDFDELLSWHWIKKGCEEVLQDGFKKCNPLNKDSDNDGIEDSKDKFPSLNLSGDIKFLEGVDLEKMPKFAEIISSKINWEVKSCWDDGTIYFLFISEVSDFEVKIQIDANYDGWFVGKDNYRVVVRTGDLKIREMWICDCSDKKKDPSGDTTTLKINKDIKVERVSIEKKCGVLIKISRNLLTGLALTENEKIGLNIGVRKKGEQNWLVLYEPNRFLECSLKK